MASGSGSLAKLGASSRSGIDTQKTIAEYNDSFAGGHNDANAQAKRNATVSGKDGDKSFVDRFYSVVTDFYEYGWGPSFHFAVTHKDDDYESAIKRHEYYLPLRMGTKPGDKLVDMGCGIAGPARNIARFSGAHVTGVTINEYQVQRANILTRQMNLEEQVNVVQGDFCKLPFADESLDGAYAIEATCHTTDKLAVFGEAYRVLKPGQCFAGYEWCTTPAYDSSNDEHQRIRYLVEVGNGLPETVPTHAVDKALKDVGFELIEARDMAGDCEPGTHWWDPLAAGLSWSGLRHTRLGRSLTSCFLWVLETLRLAPAGSLGVQRVLCTGADNLVLGGQLGIYTPCYFFLARKPLHPKKK